MKLALPKPGEGWGELLTTPLFNGGDHLPDDVTEFIDEQLSTVQSVGFTVDDSPSVIFTWHEVQPGEMMVHWASDGRVPLAINLDLLDMVVNASNGAKWLAFVRRPALMRLLASRGWVKQGEEADPYMVLMVCQRALHATAQ